MKISLQLKAICAVAIMAMSLPIMAETTSKDMTSAMKDTVITTKIKSSLATSTVTHSLNIAVETNNGVVLLRGTAKTDAEAATAVQIAESTDGVVDVDTANLMVSNNSANPANSDNKTLLADSYVTAKVKGMFMRNTLTSGTESLPVTSITVETKQGVVYLTGNVDHQSQSDLAVKLANSVKGVTKVVSDLKVGN